MANGRYPFSSTWTYKANTLNSGKWSFLRKETRLPPNNYEMWANWYLSSDGIGFGVLKRWNGTRWIECRLKVHGF